ncbi:MAG TPA: hypothetical protein VNT77_08795 [Allosphingosinicella sp.]|nr:hypothetical protein [Allosphingosinicella sp.]
MKSKKEELLGSIEAEQSVILKLIEDSKRLAARSDELMGSARKHRKTKEAEGETEDA